jgi:multidrug efflux pump
VSQNVAAPIEQQVNGADHMMYMNSTSSSTGDVTLSIFFEIGTDPSLAQVDVQNRVNLALPHAALGGGAQGVTRAEEVAAFMMIIAIYAPDGRYDPTYVDNFTNIQILDRSSACPAPTSPPSSARRTTPCGCGSSPIAMASLGPHRLRHPAGRGRAERAVRRRRLGAPPTRNPVQQTIPVTTTGRMTEASQFDEFILRAQDRRRGDRAHEGHRPRGAGREGLRGPRQVQQQERHADRRLPAAGRERTAGLEGRPPHARRSSSARFLPGLEYTIVLDTTEFVQESIDEVVHTFFEAVVLVILVVYIFLQSVRATIVPILAVPVSIIGAFIGMTAMGFSINMLTLFGMVLAIGIVRGRRHRRHRERRAQHERGSTCRRGRRRRRRWTKSAGRVVAIVLVLCAVFIPVAFLSGITGQLYKQFAITIAVSVVLSGSWRLTLSPALAAILLKPGHHEKKGFFRWFNNAFDRSPTATGTCRTRHQARRDGAAADRRHGRAHDGLFSRVPPSFLPVEDQGYIFTAAIMPDAASLDRTEAMTDRARMVSEAARGQGGGRGCPATA